jgi:hypothetical protein
LLSNHARANLLARSIHKRGFLKIGHRAALALIGWYLMVPPVSKPHAPLYRWQISKTLASSTACEAERKTMVEAVEKDMTGEAGVITFETPHGEKKCVAREAQCIDSTDPRLHHRSLLHRHVANRQ